MYEYEVRIITLDNKLFAIGKLAISNVKYALYSATITEVESMDQTTFGPDTLENVKKHIKQAFPAYIYEFRR